MMTFPGILLGHRIVHLAMKDPDVDALLEQFLSRDAGPLLDAPPSMSVGQYKDMLLSRYRNPAIGDQLLRIASDGASKLPQFVQDTARDVVSEGRRPPPHRLPAGLLHRIPARRRRPGRELPGRRAQRDGGRPRAGGRCRTSRKGLGLGAFKGWGVQEHAGFAADYARYRASIKARGAAATLKDLLAAVAAG